MPETAPGTGETEGNNTEKKKKSHSKKRYITVGDANNKEKK